MFLIQLTEENGRPVNKAPSKEGVSKISPYGERKGGYALPFSFFITFAVCMMKLVVTR